jgi:ribosome-binding factor A
MSSRRTLKAASAIREVVSMAILTELRDPRVQHVTVTFVELSSDMRYARIHVSVMGTPKEQDLCLHGLRRAAGFLQKCINDRIDTRYTPRLQFVLDHGVKNAMKVAEILHEVLPPALTESDTVEDEDEDEQADLDDAWQDSPLNHEPNEGPFDDEAQEDRPG